MERELGIDGSEFLGHQTSPTPFVLMSSSWWKATARHRLNDLADGVWLRACANYARLRVQLKSISVPSLVLSASQDDIP
jgi:hypothetical protein